MLERWSALAVRRVAGRLGIEAETLSNVHVVLPGGGSREFDVVAVIGGSPLLIECKSGQHQSAVADFAGLRQRLELPPGRVVLVAGRGSPRNEAADDVLELHGVRVVAPDTLPEALEALTAEARALPELVPPAAARVHPSPREDRDEAVTRRLRDAGLRPRPETRVPILAALVSAATDRAWPRAELERHLATRAGVSRGAVVDVLRTVARGGGLVVDGSAGPPRVTGVTGGVEALEALCPDVYRSAVRASDPTALGGREGERRLRRATGFAVGPDAEGGGSEAGQRDPRPTAGGGDDPAGGR